MAVLKFLRKIHAPTYAPDYRKTTAFKACACGYTHIFQKFVMKESGCFLSVSEIQFFRV